MYLTNIMNHPTYLDRPPLQELSHTQMSSLKKLLDRQDFKKIFEDGELFWIAFCQVFMSQPQELLKFSSDKKAIATFFIDGSTNIYKKLRLDIELLRQTLSKNDRCTIYLSGYYSETYLFVQKPSETLDQLKVQHGGAKLHYFPEYQFSLPKLLNLLGLTYSERIVKFPVSSSFGSDLLQDTYKIDVAPASDVHYPYLIAPIIIQKRETYKKLYDLYNAQKFVDVTLVGKDKQIRIHAIVLYANASPTLQKFIDSSFKEPGEQTLYLNEYSDQTLQAFVDFLYLGETALRRDNLKQMIDVDELLMLAHFFQMSDLIDACTNLLAQTVTTADVDRIKELTKLYENDHLQHLALYLHLSQVTQTTPLIKA